MKTKIKPNANSEYVIVPIVVEAGELWSATFGGGWESVGNDHIKSVEFLNDADWQTVGLARITAEDPEDEGSTVTVEVGIHDLTKAFADLASGQFYHCGQHISQDFYGGAGFDFDACSSDGMIQQMVYGKVVYG